MKTKRGFTLLEIVIVITVLGILTAVMIPIISNAIKNAKIENDKVLVDNINAILKADEPYNGRPASGDEVLWILSGNGLDVEDTNYENHAFYWSIDDNKVLIYNSEEENVLYPEELKEVEVTAEEVEEKVSSNEWFPIAGDYAYNELAYKITYYVNGKKIKFYGKTSYDGTIDKLELPMPNVYGAYSEGYEFNGWYINKDLTGDKINMIIINGSEEVNSGELVLEKLENLVFYSSFSKIPTAPDDYCTNNPNAEICQDNYCANNPDSEACGDPSKDPQDYCTENPNAEVCRDPVTSKTKYSIVYHTNGGTLNNPVTSYYGPLDETITLPIPTRDGYEFNGWYTTYNFVTGTREESIETGSIGNKVFYASWGKLPDDEEKEEKILYIITYKLDGGTISESAPKSYYGPLEEAIDLVAPIKEKCNFLGWYENPEFSGEVVTSISVGATGDKVFYAKWEPNMDDRPTNHTYYVTYELNGGTLYNPPREITGDKDFYLFTPLKRGYNFGGWYLNEDFEGEPIEVILKDDQTKDYTVYAKWIAVEYNINYNLNGGSWENSNRVNYVYTIDTVVKYTQEVIFEGYAFIGWFDNPELEGEPVVETLIGDTGDKTLYAAWDANKSNIYYRDSKDIIYKLDMSSWPKTFTFEEEVRLPVPEVDGYKFLGWYENEDLTGDSITKIEAGTMISKILYAKWETINYNINWVVNGGSWQGGSQPPLTYNVEDSTININDYIIGKHYYDFSGWYEEEDFTGDTRTTIEKGTTGDIVLYAKWEGILLEIPADFAGGTLQNRTINSFAEELEADFNAINTEENRKIQDEKNKQNPANVSHILETVKEEFKKTTHPNINYVWGHGNTELVEKYKWFFEFAKVEMLNAYNGNENIKQEENLSGNYYDMGKKYYPMLETMLDDLIAGKAQIDDLTTYNDEHGDAKTIFRGWIDGLINSRYYFSADIYRAYMVDYSQSENIQRFNLAYTGNEISVITEKELPIPQKEGSIFLGWYDHETPTAGEKSYTTSADVYDELIARGINQNSIKEEDFKLYARWQEKTKFKITFEMNGGHWEDRTLKTFAEELVFYFKLAYQADGSKPNTSVENFYNESRPNIYTVWYDAALVNKYFWLFEFLESEIDTYSPTNHTETRKFMDNLTAVYDSGSNKGKMKEGNINCFYSKSSKYNETAIDILCELIHCIINKRGPLQTSEKKGPLASCNTVYRSWIPDYSKEENIKRFHDAYYATETTKTYYKGDAMPTPVRDGYVFLGWCNDDGYMVDEFTTSGTLRALWEKTVTNDAELAEAIKNANAGNLDSIVLSPNKTYTGNYTIEKSWVTIVGPNYGINPNTSQRNPEAIFTGTFNIAESVVGIVIDGLAFTEGAKIKATTTSNFYFRNNYVYGTNAGGEWSEEDKYNNGFITILLPSGSLEDDVLSTKLSSNLNMLNNKFKEVGDVNIYIANSKDVNIKGNVFIDFQYDAIRFGDAFTAGEINIISNKFIQSTKNSGYNGIYFRMYGKTKDNSSTNIITIKYNEFKNIGNSGVGTYTGAITARNYKEFGATFDISNNYFESCYNYIRLRNNADIENHNNANYKWSATIENNIFKGIPEKYYFIAKESESDTVYNDAVFKANYYANADGTLITTLDSSKFINVSSIGTTLTQEPIVEKPAI